MRPFSPFNHRRDRELGDTLRDALGPGDHLVFVHRVLTSARGLHPDVRIDASSWDVLGAWSVPGLAAAVALTIVAMIGIRGFEPRSAEVLGAGAPLAVVTEATRTAPPLNSVDGDFVLASFFEH